MASERVVVQHQLPPLGRHLVKKVWSEVKVMDYHHWKSPSSPWSRMLIPHSILPNHTEGHRLNGRDVLSRKAGLRLGKDSTGVEASPNQDKLRRMNKYCRLQGLNRCPLAWELGTLPLDHLGFDYPPRLWVSWIDLPSFASSSKIWPNFSNKVFFSWSYEKVILTKKCVPNLSFFNEKKKSERFGWFLT